MCDSQQNERIQEGQEGFLPISFDCVGLDIGMAPKDKIARRSPAKATGALGAQKILMAERLLEEVQVSLKDYVDTRYPETQEDAEHRNVTTTLTQEQKEAAAKKLAICLDKCGSFLDLRLEDYFSGVLDRGLVQKPAKESIVALLQVVLEKDTESADEFTLVTNVLDLTSAFLEAYTERLERSPDKELVDCQALVGAVWRPLSRLNDGSDDDSKDKILHCLFRNQLMELLMKLKSPDAAAVFGSVFAWVTREMSLQELRQVQSDSTAPGIHDKLVANQEDLFQMLRTHTFLWQRLVDSKNVQHACNCFSALDQALSQKGREAQSATLLALLGLLLQGGHRNTEPLTPSARMEISNAMINGSRGLTTLWPLLNDSSNEVTFGAGVVALHNLIHFIGEETYLQHTKDIDVFKKSLQSGVHDIMEHLNQVILAKGSSGFLQYAAAFLMDIFLRAILVNCLLSAPEFPAREILKLVHVACRSLLASKTLMCSLMGGRLLWTLFSESSCGPSTILLMEAPAKHGQSLLHDMVKTLRKLSTTEDAAGLLEQPMSLPSQFKGQVWWNEGLNVLDRSFDGEVMRDDNSFIAEYSSTFLKCIDILLNVFLDNPTPEKTALLTSGAKNMCTLAAEAFQQFCSPKEESWRKPVEECRIVIEAFQLWHKLYNACKSTDKFNASICEIISRGLKGLSGLHDYFHTWEFMFKQIPWLCVSFGSVKDTAPNKYCFATDSDLFETMRTVMQPPDGSMATAGGASIDDALKYRASKLTALLHLSNFQQDISMATANELAAEAIKVLESLADTWPRQEDGNSKEKLLLDLQRRMSVMNKLILQMPASDKVFFCDGSSKELLEGSPGGDVQTEIEDVSTNLATTGTRALSDGGHDQNTDGDELGTKKGDAGEGMVRLTPMTEESIGKERKEIMEERGGEKEAMQEGETSLIHPRTEGQPLAIQVGSLVRP